MMADFSGTSTLVMMAESVSPCSSPEVEDGAAIKKNRVRHLTGFGGRRTVRQANALE